MGLRFVIGRAGTNTNSFLKNEIKQKLVEQPQGPAIFYIVPDQMTFQEEYELFNDGVIHGSIRAQVVSFSRLAWRILQETGGGTRQFISSVGIQMMLRKIIEEKQTDWKVFQKAIEKQGFLNDLEMMITEFKRHQITPEMLNMQIDHINGFVHKEPAEVSLTNKLTDLTYIYEKLVFALHGKYIDAEDQLQLLAEKLTETTLLNNAEIYIDGFHRFTPQELHIIEILMKRSKRVTIALITDKANEVNLSELDLFYQTTETYQTLQAIANENQITIEEPIVMKPENGQFKDRPYFDHLERYFDVRPSSKFEGEVPLKIAEAIHPRAEIEGVAQEILRLVREEGYRFQDMAILVRETDMYHDLIGTIFEDYYIPVFIDEKRSMLNHSLIEFIRSMFDIVESNWRYDAVFRVLKTGFIPITNEDYPLNNDAIDELENYILEYGIRSRERWTGKDDWIVQRFRGFDQAVQTDAEKAAQERINKYRQQVVDALTSFDQQIRKVTTVRELCETTYLLLDELHIPERLEKLQKQYDDVGQNEKAREQEQVWDAVIQLLDEMVEMAGEESMTLPIFRATLEAGFESLKFAHVPPSIDHVIVGTIDRSRMSGIKCAFLLGVNEGAWPMKPAVDGMINETEREILANHGLQLAESNRRILLDDWFYMYLAFTVAKDRLWVSYLLSDEEGKSKMPSQLIHKLRELFPLGGDTILLQDPEELVEADRFITTPLKTRSALTAQLARNRKGYPLKPIWMHVFNWFVENHSKYSTTYQVLQSLYYQNKPVNLTKETVEQLYPKQIDMSVSRLETYYRSSYQHFAKYTLGLKERRIHKLDAPDIGLLFHEALKKITEWIQGEGKDFARLSIGDAEQYANRAVSSLSAILQHQILHSSNRHQYIQKKLQEVVARAVFILSEQAKQSQFTPIALELSFGKNQTLPSVTIPLPNGFEINLRGQIDRVDKAIKNGELLLRIIDYKSSARGLDLVEVYYGLSLQMLTYLDVLLSHAAPWLGMKATPAGIFYFHVHNPMISAKDRLDSHVLSDEILKRYKMQGLLLADEEVARLMDTSLESGSSPFIPAGLKKNGGFYSYSKVASEETFSDLQAHIRRLMIQAGLDITNGGVHLNPFQYKTQTGNTWDPYVDISQFDPTLEENNYRKLVNMTEQEVLERIRKEGEQKW